MPSLSGRVVAITGASAGIGRACAERLARAGASVVLSARRADRLREVVDVIAGRGGAALAVPSDVTSEADMRALVARAVESYGRLDVMICNAGIGHHMPFEDTPTDAMRRLVDVNLMGTLYAAHAAIQVFTRQQSGHIIAVSSIAGRRGISESSIYSATKAAQIGFIEALRAEFVGTSLHASIVFPVSTKTDFHDTIRRDFDHEIRPVGPRQSPETVADAIVRCVISPRAEVYPYRRAWLLAVLNVVAPEQTDRVIQRFRRRRKGRDRSHAGPHA